MGLGELVERTKVKMKHIAQGYCEKCGKKNALFHVFEDKKDRTKLIFVCVYCGDRRTVKKDDGNKHS